MILSQMINYTCMIYQKDGKKGTDIKKNQYIYYIIQKGNLMYHMV